MEDFSIWNFSWPPSPSWPSRLIQQSPLISVFRLNHTAPVELQHLSSNTYRMPKHCWPNKFAFQLGYKTSGLFGMKWLYVVCKAKLKMTVTARAHWRMNLTRTCQRPNRRQMPSFSMHLLAIPLFECSWSSILQVSEGRHAQVYHCRDELSHAACLICKSTV